MASPYRFGLHPEIRKALTKARKTGFLWVYACDGRSVRCRKEDIGRMVYDKTDPNGHSIEIGGTIFKVPYVQFKKVKWFMDSDEPYVWERPCAT